MISDVLFDAISDIDHYLANGMYKNDRDLPHILAVREAMGRAQHRLDCGLDDHDDRCEQYEVRPIPEVCDCYACTETVPQPGRSA